MLSLLKYIKNSIMGQKKIFFLLNFIIFLCCFLFIFAQEITFKIENDYTKPLKFQSEDREFVITKKGENPFFLQSDIKKNQTLSELVAEIRINGTYKYKQISKVNLVAKEGESSSDEQDNFGKEKLTEKESLILKKTADYLDKKVGDTLEIAINGVQHSFKVKEIVENEKLLYFDKKNDFTIICSYDYLSEILEQPDKVNLMYVNSKEENKSTAIKKFNNQNKGFRLEEVYNAENLNQEIAWLKNGLLLILGIILILSIFLIYNAFKIIIEERMPEVGTFITLGASKKSIKGIFLLESLIYGLFGSLVGCVGAYVVMGLIYSEKSVVSSSIIESYVPHFSVYIYGILLGILLSLGACLLSLQVLNRKKELEIINNVQNERSFNDRFWYFGYFFTLGSSLLLLFYTNNFVISCIGIFLFLISLCLFVVLITRIIAKTIQKWNHSKRKFLYLLANDLLCVKELRNCMILIVIVFFSIATISSISFSLSQQMKSGYNELNFDYVVQNIPPSMNSSSNTSFVLNRLESDSTISMINPMVLTTSKAKEKDSGAKTVIGIKPATFIPYVNDYLKLDKKSQKIIRSLGAKDQVVISKMFAEIHHKKAGDSILLSINDKEKSYKIAAVIDGKTFYNGNFLLITNEKLQKDFDVYEATYIYFKGKENDQQILTDIEIIGATWASKKDELQSSLATADRLVGMIEIVSFSAVVIAIIGLLSNISLMVLKRKSEFFIYSTLGLTTGKLKAFLIFEIFVISTCSFLSIVLFMPVLQWILTKLMYLIGMSLEVVVQIKPFFVNYLVLLVFAILSNLFIFKNRITMH